MSHNSCRIHSLNGAIVKRYATNTYDLHVMLVVIDIVSCLIISLFCCCCFIYVSYNILERIDVVGFRVEGKAVEETCCKPVEGKQTVEFSITFLDDKYFYVSIITFFLHVYVVYFGPLHGSWTICWCINLQSVKSQTGQFMDLST